MKSKNIYLLWVYAVKFAWLAFVSLETRRCKDQAHKTQVVRRAPVCLQGEGCTQSVASTKDERCTPKMRGVQSVASTIDEGCTQSVASTKDERCTPKMRGVHSL